jgi:hypothetical protein
MKMTSNCTQKVPLVLCSNTVGLLTTVLYLVINQDDVLVGTNSGGARISIGLAVAYLTMQAVCWDSDLRGSVQNYYTFNT